MADGKPTYTSLPQAWHALMTLGLQGNYVRAAQSLNTRRALRNYMAGRPLWK